MRGRQMLFTSERLVALSVNGQKIQSLTCALPLRQALLAHLVPECRGRAVGLLHEFRLRTFCRFCLPSRENRSLKLRQPKGQGFRTRPDHEMSLQKGAATHADQVLAVGHGP